MKIRVLFLLCVIKAAVAQCPTACNSNEKCLRDYETGVYSCITIDCKGKAFNQDGMARQYGTLRKCGGTQPSPCYGSNGQVTDVSQCCAGVGFQQFTDLKMTKCSLVCIDATSCDVSEGCAGNINCPGVEECIDGKCVIPIPGTQCGECGKLPINGRCCGSGVKDHDGTCYCATGKKDCHAADRCTANFDCCDDGQCCRSGTCYENGGSCQK
jgi:hypothetical protein